MEISGKKTLARYKVGGVVRKRQQLNRSHSRSSWEGGRALEALHLLAFNGKVREKQKD